ncbi:MAG: hypothetical protein ACTJLM_04245 [Ehrlichia sp.]
MKLNPNNGGDMCSMSCLVFWIHMIVYHRDFYRKNYSVPILQLCNFYSSHLQTQESGDAGDVACSAFADVYFIVLYGIIVSV